MSYLGFIRSSSIVSSNSFTINQGNAFRPWSTHLRLAEEETKMAEVVYLLCMVASFICAGLLYNGYRRTKTRLILYCCLCFVGLALNNLCLVIDDVVIPG